MLLYFRRGAHSTPDASPARIRALIFAGVSSSSTIPPCLSNTSRRFYWLQDVETSSPLALAIEELCTISEWRVPWLALTELEMTLFVNEAQGLLNNSQPIIIAKASKAAM